MSIAVIIAIIAGGTLALSLAVAIVRGSYLLGKLVNKVENQDAKIDNLETKIDTLTVTVNELRAEVRQTNKILVGLANHTHPQDMDGRTFFTVPS